MKNKYVKLILIIILFSFICSYVISLNGYYEYSLRNQTLITNKKIKEFEQAVKDNANIDELDFFNEDKINYTNKFSNVVYNISDKGNSVIKKYLKKVFKKINKVMLEE